MGKQTDLFSGVAPENYDDDRQYQILIVEASGDDLVRLRAEKVRPQRYGPGKGGKPRPVKKALAVLLCLLAQGCLTPTFTFSTQGDGGMGGDIHEADGGMGGEGGAP